MGQCHLETLAREELSHNIVQTDSRILPRMDYELNVDVSWHRF